MVGVTAGAIMPIIITNHMTKVSSMSVTSKRFIAGAMAAPISMPGMDMSMPGIGATSGGIAMPAASRNR